MKEKRVVEIRVIIEPRYWLEKTTKEKMNVCDHIVKQVERHIDDVQCVYTDCVKEDVCEFCGSSWTEDDDTFNGGCCDKDMENEPADN